MTWILIIWMNTTGLTTAEFNNKEQCELALSTFKDNVVWGSYHRGFCIEKGQNDDR